MQGSNIRKTRAPPLTLPRGLPMTARSASPRRSPTMTRPLSVAVSGLGTVGAGVLNQLRDNAGLGTACHGRPTARAVRPAAAPAISPHNPNNGHWVPSSALPGFEAPVAHAGDPADDVIVE